jgi:hypothetical protein
VERNQGNVLETYAGRTLCPFFVAVESCEGTQPIAAMQKPLCSEDQTPITDANSASFVHPPARKGYDSATRLEADSEAGNMAEIINLNKARKRKTRVDAEQKAAENRLRFGRTKAQRNREAAEDEIAQRRLDQSRRESESKP